MNKYTHSVHSAGVLSFFFLLLGPLLSQGQGRDKNDLFSGFRNLETARTNLPIGAVWTQVGPAGTAASSSQLTTSQSYTTLSSTANRTASAGVAGGILKLLTANIGFNASTNVTVTIDSVSIVTLNSPEVLINNANSFVLYEAMRAEKLTFKVDKSKAATLAAGLQQLLEAKVTVDAEAGANNTQTVTTRGARLFVAYRLARVDLVDSKKSKATIKFQGNFRVSTTTHQFIAVEPNLTYTSPSQDLILLPGNAVTCVSNCQGNINSCMSNCAAQADWLATVIDHTQTQGGQPVQRVTTFRSSFNMANKSFGLSYKTTGQGFTYSYLFIERLDLSLARTRPDVDVPILLVKEKGEKAYVKEDKYKYSNATAPFVTAW